MTTIAECAKHLDMLPGRFEDLVAAGVIEKPAAGGFVLDDVRAAYLNHLRARASGGVDRSGVEQEKAADEARLAKAKADKAEMEAQEMRRELLPAGDFAAGLHNAVAMLKTRLNAVSYRKAPIVHCAASVAAAEKAIRVEVDEAMTTFLAFDPLRVTE